ncbi:uncharacterized protein [Amphiura filiformis]|uniref:uncharacterized protein n=1 Tax=Amphiura filiformis TaxID=82378 RepID=UPI003B22579B
MPRPRSPRRHSRSPRRQRDRRHRSPSTRSRSRSRSRGVSNRSPPARRYSRDSPPPKAQRRRSLTPQPRQAKYGGRRSRSFTPTTRGQTSGTSYTRRSRSPAYQEQAVSGRSSPRNYRDQSPDYYQKPKESQVPTYVVVNRDRSYSPDRRRGQQYDDRRDEPRDLDARLRAIEARSPELTKPQAQGKGDYSRNSPRASASYDKSRQSGGEYRGNDRSPERYKESRQESRDYEEPARKDSYNDNYQASGKSYSPPRRESRDHQRNGTSSDRRRSKDAKYTKSSPDNYRSPERDGRKYKDDARQDRHDRDRRESNNVDRGRRDDDKYSEKKERSGRDRSSHSNHASSSRDGYESSQKSHHRKDSSTDKSHQDRESQRKQHSPVFDPSLVIVPRRKDEGRGGIFNRPEIQMRPITDDPDNQPMPFEEKRVVAVMPGKQLPGPAVSDRDLHRDYLELLARKDFEVRKEKFRDLTLDTPQTLSSRFQGASSLDLLTTLENFEISRTKDLQRELELRREMDLLRERSPPIRLSDLQSDLEERLAVMERKVEPKNPRDLRHDLESRRKQLKAGRIDTTVSSRRAVTKKTEKDSKLRMTSADHRRPVRERLGLSPGKRERRDRREVEERTELPDFKKEVEELQRAQWIEDPKSVPKGPGYFEHDDREGESSFGLTTRGRGGLRGRGRGVGFRGRGSIFLRGRGGAFRGAFRGSGVRGGFRGSIGRGRGTYRGRSSPQWKHDKFEGEKEKKHDKEDKRGSSGSKAKTTSSRKESSSGHGSRSDDRHTSRKDDRKSTKDSRDRRPDRSRGTTGSRARDSRDSRKDRR